MKKPNVVVIGAGSATFTKNLIGDLLLMDDIQLGRIGLVDINEEKLKVMDLSGYPARSADCCDV